MDRVHRQGQQQDVHVYRFCVEDSIEERMMALQEQKRDLMKASRAWVVLGYQSGGGLEAGALTDTPTGALYLPSLLPSSA